MSIVCERLRTPTAAELQQIQEIYETNFPPAERKPFDSLIPRLASGDYACWVARIKTTQEIVAFALLAVLTGEDLVFLEYIAVKQERQGSGLGSRLFDALKYLGKPIVWEVEPPSVEPDSIPNRRIRFYERFGGEVIDLSMVYEMPNYEKPGEGVPLLLMHLRLEKQPNKREFAAIVRGIYEVAYPEYGELRDRIIKKIEANFNGS